MPPLRTAFLRSACVSVALVAEPAMHAQLPAPPATTEDALHQMLSESGIVFTGQVTAIRRVEAANGSTGILEIDFAVDDAILGTTPNSTYILREWAGVAPNSDSTFLVGRRYLMLLHAPGPSGLSSPVGGPDGAIPILPTAEAASPAAPDAAGFAAQAALAQTAQDVNSAAPRSPAHSTLRLVSAPNPFSSTSAGCPIPPGGMGCRETSSPVTTTSSPLASAAIDLRWIAARVLSPLSYARPATPPEPHPILTRANVTGASASLLAADSTQTTPSTAGSLAAFNPSNLAFEPPPLPTPVQPPTTADTYANVLTLLRSWAAIRDRSR